MILEKKALIKKWKPNIYLLKWFVLLNNRVF